MQSLTSPTWITIKGALLLVLGLLAGTLLFLRQPTLYERSALSEESEKRAAYGVGCGGDTSPLKGCCTVTFG